MSCLARIMAVAQEELHSSLKRVRGECTRVKRKLEESCEKGERLKVIAVEREKVRNPNPNLKPSFNPKACLFVL